MLTIDFFIVVTLLLHIPALQSTFKYTGLIPKPHTSTMVKVNYLFKMMFNFSKHIFLLKHICLLASSAWSETCQFFPPLSPPICKSKFHQNYSKFQVMYLKISVFYIQIKIWRLKTQNFEITLKFLKHKLLHIFCNFLKLKKYETNMEKRENDLVSCIAIGIISFCSLSLWLLSSFGSYAKCLE